jgi:predicted phage baseplate assembly protein
VSALENRPGLSAIAYAPATYAGVRRALLERIARTPELAGLRTRRSDDFSIAVLELWAALADVLGFYQERYANEAYLRTATRRESVARLARLLDYDPRPGVAALAYLAYGVEAGKAVELPPRSRVGSVPGPGERAVTFETLEPLRADWRLNRLPVVPRSVPAAPLAAGATEAVLDRGRPELAASLAPGDRVGLFVDGAAQGVEVKEVREVRVEGDRVVVAWTQPVRGAAWGARAQAWKLRRSFRAFGHDAPATFVGASPTPGAPATRLAWSVRSVDMSLPASARLALDARYDGIVAGARLLVVAGARTTLVTVESVAQAQHTLGPLADTVTEVTVTPALPAIADRRTVVVHELAGDAPIGFARATYPPRLTGTTVYLPGRWTGDGVEVGRTIRRGAFADGVVLRPAELEVGRRVLLADAERTVPARVGRSPAVVPASPAVGALCHLAVPVTPDEPLDLDTRTAVLLGNVALAGHGESVRDEPLGSGDAAKAFQRFALARAPLTHVPGAGSTLELLVDGVRWHERPSLHGAGPTDRVYVVRTQEDGTSAVQFGDGVNGARLPTGNGNVRATYRIGAGLAGRLGPRRLTSALDRPPGLVDVTNPLPAEGGADAETVEDARRNAPTTVRTFGRAVSLRDLEDLARASGEVAKAQATWVWDGHGSSVHLTVAAQGGADLGAESLRRLRGALDGARDRSTLLAVANALRVPVVVAATVAVEPDRVRADVEAAAHAALVAALSFERAELGRPLRLGDVYVALQAVPGVVSADVDALTFKDAREVGRRGGVLLPDGRPAPVQPVLRLDRARQQPGRRGQLLPAELAFLEAPTQDAVVSATGGLAG